MPRASNRHILRGRPEKVIRFDTELFLFFEKLGTGETCNGDLCFSNAYRQGEHVTSLRPFFEKDQ
jgi:hypothetical protein